MPSTAVAPQFDDRASNWIAPDAVIIGNVRIGRNVGIWFGAVLRGDNEPIDDRRRHQRAGAYASCTPIRAFR